MNGLGDGFNKAASHCHPGATCPPFNVRAYGYVPEDEVEPYFVMARHYAFASEMFHTSQGTEFSGASVLVERTVHNR